MLCSDQVGAHALIERFGAGSVFLADDQDALYRSLEELLSDPLSLARMREATIAAAQAIDPAVAAGYLLAVIQADAADRPKVPSPWYRLPRDGHG